MFMNKAEFCESFVYLKKRPISFAGRPYLRAPYKSSARRLVIRASRQVEKSTFLVNTILYWAVRRPGVQILFVCPRLEQARVFSTSRLLPAILESPFIKRCLLGKGRQKLQVMNVRCANGSEVYIRAAYHSADAARGIDADLLLIDEFVPVHGIGCLRVRNIG
jgi:Phage terminase large subunit gpA, ATPase domain